MQNMSEAIGRIEASMRALDERMRRASGDLDYETHLHEKRALAAALLALRRKRAQTAAAEQHSDDIRQDRPGEGAASAD